MDPLTANARLHGLEIVYTNSRRVLLAAGHRKCRPVIRAHRCFRGCSQQVAEAVVSLFCGNTGVNPRRVVLGYVRGQLSDVRDPRINLPGQRMARLGE